METWFSGQTDTLVKCFWPILQFFFGNATYCSVVRLTYLRAAVSPSASSFEKIWIHLLESRKWRRTLKACLQRCEPQEKPRSGALAVISWVNPHSGLEQYALRASPSWRGRSQFEFFVTKLALRPNKKSLCVLRRLVTVPRAHLHDQLSNCIIRWMVVGRTEAKI